MTEKMFVTLSGVCLVKGGRFVEEPLDPGSIVYEGPLETD